ncbi:DUF3093 domain-containing protein [Actinoplanes sp. Pm04-4]|uniref:DUF3093 domain-containing protein n=1 Tax=Paractinoplanes pyxinae TaxID=2997416 RepID=A0ABT4B2Y9_9ACTN|nr:DUF3093 domain-containing protein [Actinoplanes pyxinae]MCY1140245.1 DUF3093 domain-containing protein [Actinoplanes pyxinae]
MTPESSTRTTAAPAYAERLHLTWWIWPVMLLVVAILGFELMLGFPDVPAWVVFAVLVPLALAGMAWVGRIRVAVTAGEFQVDDARLPLEFVKDVVALDAEGKREALGVGAHPLAFVVQRPWIGPAVQVLLDDPADPTPYWIVSTRHPVELATALLNRR